MGDIVALRLICVTFLARQGLFLGYRTRRLRGSALLSRVPQGITLGVCRGEKTQTSLGFRVL